MLKVSIRDKINLEYISGGKTHVTTKSHQSNRFFEKYETFKSSIP